MLTFRRRNLMKRERIMNMTQLLRLELKINMQKLMGS
jgi:hypothetical protein